MRKRFKGYTPPKVEQPDHGALFVQAARRIVRGAGLLEAYRRGSGLLLVTNRTREAEASLAAAIERAITRFSYGQMDRAYENSGRSAMCEYLDQWWTTKLCDAPLDVLGAGDEFFSRQTVREITEQGADRTPDASGGAQVVPERVFERAKRASAARRA